MNHLNGPLPDRARAEHDLDGLIHDFGRHYVIAGSREGTLLAAQSRDAGEADPVLLAPSAAVMRRELETDYASRSLRRVAPEHVPVSHRRPG